MVRLKHRNEGKFLEVVVSEKSISILNDIKTDTFGDFLDVEIKYNSPYRKTFLYECMFSKHGAYPDQALVSILCPLMELLSKDFNGMVILKEYL